MPLTLEESLTATRDLLADHAMHLVDDSLLIEWLDQGQQDAAAYTLCYQRIATVLDTDTPAALIAGQRVYHLVMAVGGGGFGLSDYLRVLHVQCNGVPLLRWTPVMPGIAGPDTAGQGTPRFYLEFAGALEFFPAFDPAALETYRLEVTYAALPAPWTAGQASVLPAGADLLATWYAGVRVAMQRRQWRLAATWWEMYMAALESIRLTQLLQAATTQAEQRQPVRTERTDEPRRLEMVARQRQMLRGRPR